MQIFDIKSKWQQVAQRICDRFAVDIEAYHLHVGCEFKHELPTHTTRRAMAFALRGNDDTRKLAMTGTDGMTKGNSLGADANGVRGVFDITTGENRAVAAFESSPHGEMRVRAISLVEHRHGQFFEFVNSHRHAFMVETDGDARASAVPIRQHGGKWTRHFILSHIDLSIKISFLFLGWLWPHGHTPPQNGYARRAYAVFLTRVKPSL